MAGSKMLGANFDPSYFLPWDGWKDGLRRSDWEIPKSLERRFQVLIARMINLNWESIFYDCVCCNVVFYVLFLQDNVSPDVYRRCIDTYRNRFIGWGIMRVFILMSKFISKSGCKRTVFIYFFYFNANKIYSLPTVILYLQILNPYSTNSKKMILNYS